MSSSRPELKFSDISEERRFYKRYLNLPEKPSTTLRSIDKGEYYTIIGNDAIFVADCIYHTQSVLKDCRIEPSVAKLAKEPLKYVTVLPQVFSTLLKTCLLDLGYKVEIFDKTCTLSKSASPGNIEQVQDLMNLAVDSSIVIAALKLQFNTHEGHCVIGVAFIDTSNYKIGMLDIIDNEVYSNLESFLIQLGVRECLVPDIGKSESIGAELKKVIGVIERCACVSTLVKPSEFSEKDVELDLANLVGDELSLSLPHYSKPALSSCGALLSYLQLLNEQDQVGKYELVQHSLQEFMKLDASAIKALNLFPQTSTQPFGPATGISLGSGGSKVSSLFQLLNHCKTNAGVRLLNEWLKQPLTDVELIEKRHVLVDYLIDQLELKQLLQTEHLPLVLDVRRITKKLNRNGTLEDVLKIYQFSKKVPEIAELLSSFLEDDQGTPEAKSLVTSTWLDPLMSHTEPLSKLQEMVETTVDLSAYEEHNEFMIKVELNEELAKIKDQLDDLKDEINAIHLQAAEDLGFDPEKKLKLENHHIHGWCMRLTRNDARELRKHKQYLELSTVKAGIFFTTKKLKEIASETAVLQREYDRQQSALVKEIVSITLTYSPVLEKLSLVLANLDVLCSFAHASSYAPIPYVRPKMHALNSTRNTRLVASRHPVLEVQDDVTFIANDVHLEKGVEDFLIITGPNMGGKSTYIRQVGVISLMAQIGCFVPCDEAEIAVVDAVLCRVGAGDSQLKGVSTFMVEMLETASILKNATSNSLIIVDELGRGTSTYDGFGLAWAIAEYIASKVGCFSLFATHFHELTALADQLPNVKNMQVVAHLEKGESGRNDSDDITLLYKVEPGISDQSFGIYVAEVVQFPQKIVKMAKRKANELEELKEYNQDSKKARLSITELNEGNTCLKQLLKKWVAELREQGLDDPQKLSEEQSQAQIQELLRLLARESSDNKFLKDISETLV
ncbi:BN860_10858g1_1 [Zygosaccharomyces bailii CLIB 213]|uniref:DNA mismatch repair protein MSH2 n=1 Tax=Zygosaccharomyces bailii (strain CLIB 213 / ATCC 58445 / CBS 680 / BCRC 21525 / NBRC 1098 / NCYC 1416 / NRRL Y-2227) TaxID=1333698 RepID=A0A8J2T3W0_ZYGB2|nr:BN860_10858g1_1 [Zygosaccharomyces bailii CLIB 213]